jgi:phenylalanyl-tRNA synthetase beta chain
MQVTLNWLRRYVHFEDSPSNLAERLTMLGLEVEAVHPLVGDFQGVVVAQVLSRDPHPNADKLSVCRVHDGSGERQIVCGAHNFKPGDKVPLILPGASLPPKPNEKPFVVKVGKIRGVESHGMMCSGSELGLSQDHEGLLILPESAVTGQSLAEFLGRPSSDVVYDLEITPNRPDLNSVIGIAREIAASTGQPLLLPEADANTNHPSDSRHVSECVTVRIDDPDLCPRYTARVIHGVRIGPSPDWLRAALDKVGLRSINNVVDVTNFVMLESGQPLHAFDYHLLAPGPNSTPSIIVRRARPGESFTTLDDRNHALTDQMLLIADPQKPIALAGIMGGQNSEINPHTVDVLIESACFNPTNIRRTAKSLGLRTDASYRFERGADIGITEWASRRCTQLILETAGGLPAQGVVDAFPHPPPPRQITLRHHKVGELLGIDIAAADVEYHLGQLGLKMLQRKPRPLDAPPALEPVTFQIPTFRLDLKREIDLIEEVARLHGVDRIPATTPRCVMASNEFDSVYDACSELRRSLAALGLNEAQGQTLIAASAATLIDPNPVLLHNPLSSDMTVLRPSLLPGLLDSLRHNLNHRNERVALFELGRVFTTSDSSTRESVRLAIALTGPRHPTFWNGEDRDALFDAHDLKGLLEEFLDRCGLRGIAYPRRESPTSLFIESATINLGSKIALGQFGQLTPTLARRYDLRAPVFLAELDLDQIMARRNTARQFKPLPQFPSAKRDAAFLMPETVTHEAILQTIRQCRVSHLESVELFDVFRGKHVPQGHKSMAYAFTYRHPDRTLTDSEISAVHDRLVSHLTKTFQAQLRA